MRTIGPSELIINPDGSIFHLHLRPGQIADTIILVGDPARVAQVAAHFDSRETDPDTPAGAGGFTAVNREFYTVTGSYRGRRMTVLSHGIGTDNIDIVATELDALVNVDFDTRQAKPGHKRLTLLRLGTSGALQSDLRIGDMVFARTSVGFDGLLGFYEGSDKICNREMERAFVEHTGWSDALTRPYFVDADRTLYELFKNHTKEGITISAPGFYGPQGRHIRLRPADPGLNGMIESYRFEGRRITNFEMESSALAGLGRLLGHRAATICTIIAQRVTLETTPDYRPFVEQMIKMSLDRLAEIQ
jgi:uridine phosphorylase